MNNGGPLIGAIDQDHRPDGFWAGRYGPQIQLMELDDPALLKADMTGIYIRLLGVRNQVCKNESSEIGYKANMAQTEASSLHLLLR